MIGSNLGAGREAEVYACGDDAVVKLYRPGFGGHRAEAVALANLDGHGVAPKLIDIVDHEGRTGLVLERLGGSDMLARLQAQPWQVLGARPDRAGDRVLLVLHLHHQPATGHRRRGADPRHQRAGRLHRCAGLVGAAGRDRVDEQRVMTALLDLVELADRAGVPAARLRHFDDAGLLPAAADAHDRVDAGTRGRMLVAIPA